jgi:UDP-glucose 4-epimerase
MSQDYVIGSGEGTPISEVLSIIFSFFNLDWSRHVEIDNRLLRKGDPLSIVSNPTKINNQLNWKSEHSIEDLLKRCISYKKNVTQNEEPDFSSHN